MLRKKYIIEKHRIKQKAIKLLALWKEYLKWCKNFDNNYDLEIENIQENEKY